MEKLMVMVREARFPYLFFFPLTESICLKIRDETAKRTLFWWLLCYASTLQLYEPKASK